jgi:hypothetical protein
VTFGFTVSARAQWIAYDPTLHTQSILNTAQEIAKRRDDQQPGAANQLNEFKQYESLFGDPKAVLLTTVQPARERPSQD